MLRQRDAYAEIRSGDVVARFGPFWIRVALDNIERWELSGPYRWYTALGVRGTPGRGDITFGGNAHGGIGLFLRQPLRWIWVRRLQQLYLTLDDLDGFAAQLSQLGIPGQDIRTILPAQPD